MEWLGKVNWDVVSAIGGAISAVCATITIFITLKFASEEKLKDRANFDFKFSIMPKKEMKKTESITDEELINQWTYPMDENFISQSQGFDLFWVLTFTNLGKNKAKDLWVSYMVINDNNFNNPFLAVAGSPEVYKDLFAMNIPFESSDYIGEQIIYIELHYSDVNLNRRYKQVFKYKWSGIQDNSYSIALGFLNKNEQKRLNEYFSQRRHINNQKLNEKGYVSRWEYYKSLFVYLLIYKQFYPRDIIKDILQLFYWLKRRK